MFVANNHHTTITKGSEEMRKFSRRGSADLTAFIIVIGAIIVLFLGPFFFLKELTLAEMQSPRAFPIPLPRSQTPEQQFRPNVPYRVLKVNRELGVADVEEADGNTFFTKDHGVVALEPGTYFIYSRDAEMNMSLKTLSEKDIDFSRIIYSGNIP